MTMEDKLKNIEQLIESLSKEFNIHLSNVHKDNKHIKDELFKIDTKLDLTSERTVENRVNIDNLKVEFEQLRTNCKDQRREIIDAAKKEIKLQLWTSWGTAAAAVIMSFINLIISRGGR